MKIEASLRRSINKTLHTKRRSELLPAAVNVFDHRDYENGWRQGPEQGWWPLLFVSAG
jgi:hypothetical protein